MALLFRGWNDDITSSDLELDKDVKNKEMIPVPDEILEDDLKK